MLSHNMTEKTGLKRKGRRATIAFCLVKLKNVGPSRGPGAEMLLRVNGPVSGRLRGTSAKCYDLNRNVMA